MAKVSSLVIKKQSGTNNSYFASWTFNETKKNATTSSGAIKVGDLVSIKSGATWYNGASIDSWVFGHKWYVYQVSGNRAVIHKNQSGTNAIMSPINVSNLIGPGSKPSTTTTQTIDHYSTKWYYDTGNGIWFTGSSSDVKTKNTLYSAPEGALRIKIVVRPYSKTRKVNGKDASYWTGTDVSATYTLAIDPPEKPPTPTVSIDKYKLTATIDNISDPRTDKISYEVYSGVKLIKTNVVTVVTRRATFSWSVAAGGEYRVRCRAINLYGKTNIYGPYSDYSSVITTIPTTPSGITICRAASETSIYLEWSAVTTATTYDLEYTTNKNYFDKSDQTTVVSGIEFTKYEKTGLESGKEYFFRVRAVNDKGNSAWSGIKSVIIGKKPAAPTTWSSTTTSITGEPLVLYWVHNVEDGSSMRFAELEIYVDGVKEVYTIKGLDDSDPDKDKTHSYNIDTSQYTEGTKIQWRVRTSGITGVYGDWSIQRTIDIYAPPTLDLSITDIENNQITIIESFPFIISGVTGPKTQAPTGYHVLITSNEIYETVDNVGNKIIVNKGDEVYSKYFDIAENLSVTLSASDLDLENDVTYNINCIASMNSGLTVESSLEFVVSWIDVSYDLDAEISIDEDILVAYIKPYCIDEEGYLIEDILLSVYRREFDGSFTELISNLENTENTVISDPHPALDYARYRIVAITKATGAVSYYDTPNYPIQEKSAVIQWSEDWVNFDIENEDVMKQPPWAGSLLKLPYNVDVSDKHQTDVAHVEYIGRKRPVSYYGTQLGESASWSMDIPKNDIETLYAIRRLAIYTGDVYVREPSGSGYWASVSVSFSQKHKELTIPISLDITRVEGGM